MSAELPEPPVPPEVDLRGMEFMPLHGDRLFASATWISASPEAKVAALRLWWHSFAKESPAASLPDNDTLLADYAGYGVAVKAWLKIKPQAMRGWTLCRDGRLYHKVVGEVAIEAWEHRQKFRQKRETDSQRLREWRERALKRREKRPSGEDICADETRFETTAETRFSTPPETRFETQVKRVRREGIGKEEKKDNTLECLQDAARASPDSGDDGNLDPPEFLDRRGKTAIPIDWKPDASALMAARGSGLSEGEIEHETNQFRNHYTATGALFADWGAAWRKWLGNRHAHRDRGERGGQRPGRRSDVEIIAEAAADRAARADF